MSAFIRKRNEERHKASNFLQRYCSENNVDYSKFENADIEFIDNKVVFTEKAIRYSDGLKSDIFTIPKIIAILEKTGDSYIVEQI